MNAQRYTHLVTPQGLPGGLAARPAKKPAAKPKPLKIAPRPSPRPAAEDEDVILAMRRLKATHDAQPYIVREKHKAMAGMLRSQGMEVMLGEDGLIKQVIGTTGKVIPLDRYLGGR